MAEAPERATISAEGRASRLIAGPLFWLYGRSGRTVRATIRRVLWRVEGTGLYSLTLRRIAAVYHGVEVGMYTRGPLAAIDHYPRGTRIGRYSSIHPSVRVFGANHPMNTRSTHALFYNPALLLAQRDLLTRTRLTVGHDVFIGYGAIITSSVSDIGDGAVIGAGAVVHQNVPPFAIVVGNPARVVRYRFSKALIEELRTSAWWQQPLHDLAGRIEAFQTPLESEHVR